MLGLAQPRLSLLHGQERRIALHQNTIQVHLRDASASLELLARGLGYLLDSFQADLQIPS
jgi:hypothetical protein